MKKELLSIHYCDANSILVINPKGKLRKIYTPFSADCIENVDSLKKGTRLFVEEVSNNLKDQLLFIIHGRAYLFSHFQN